MRHLFFNQEETDRERNVTFFATTFPDWTPDKLMVPRERPYKYDKQAINILLVLLANYFQLPDMHNIVHVLFFFLITCDVNEQIKYPALPQ